MTFLKLVQSGSHGKRKKKALLPTTQLLFQLTRAALLPIVHCLIKQPLVQSVIKEGVDAFFLLKHGGTFHLTLNCKLMFQKGDCDWNPMFLITTKKSRTYFQINTEDLGCVCYFWQQLTWAHYKIIPILHTLLKMQKKWPHHLPTRQTKLGFEWLISILKHYLFKGWLHWAACHGYFHLGNTSGPKCNHQFMYWLCFSLSTC